MSQITAKTKEELSAELLKIKEKQGEKPVFALTTYIDEDEDKERTIYLVKPNRLTRQAGEKEIQRSAWKGAEVFLRGMYVGGDDLNEIIENDDAMMIASEQLVHVIKLRSGNVQKV
jgi:hypothetical protein